VSPVLQREASSSRRVWEQGGAAGQVAEHGLAPASSGRGRGRQVAVQNAANGAKDLIPGRVRDLDSLPLTAHNKQQQLGHLGDSRQRSRSPASHSGHSANHPHQDHQKQQHQQRRRRGASSPERPAAGREQRISHVDVGGRRVSHARWSWDDSSSDEEGGDGRGRGGLRGSASSGVMSSAARQAALRQLQQYQKAWKWSQGAD
jgi:hypothetical protein